METYIFAALDEYSHADLNNIEQYLLEKDNFYEVVLADEEQLQVLFGLLKIDDLKVEPLPGNDYFQKVMDFSNSSLPSFSQDEFDSLYAEWLQATGRESSMDEYGQLVFLQGQYENFNSKKCRLALHAKS